MEQTYKIVGIGSGNGYKKLELKQIENMVNENDEVSITDALKSMSGLVQKTQNAFLKSKQFDVIRIPDKLFKELHLEIDGLFTISY